jgi:chromosomal replication initiation ATPase DnaA
MLAQAVIAAVAQRHNLVARDLTGEGRFAHIVAARREAARELRLARMPLSAIGKALGRHHTTVKHYVEQDGWE